MEGHWEDQTTTEDFTEIKGGFRWTMRLPAVSIKTLVMMRLTIITIL